MAGVTPVRLRLLSRPGCGLCEELLEQVDRLLADLPRQWEIVDVDGDPELARRYGETIPILYVNDRLFARIRLPKLASRLRLLRAARRR
jgi:ABC-type uncharacterized transport system ATPase subunit